VRERKKLESVRVTKDKRDVWRDSGASVQKARLEVKESIRAHLKKMPAVDGAGRRLGKSRISLRTVVGEEEQ